MARILEKIRQQLGTAQLGFQETSVNLTSALKDKNDVSNKLGNFSKSLKYGFFIIDKTNRQIVNSFDLQINPQELNQEEPFAIQITPTQQGIVVEHQGSVIKKLILTGTCGFKPGAGAGGVNSSGRFRTANGETGYQQFHNFRNFLREYVDLKKDTNQRNLQLVFKNTKDNEYFIVEPESFKMPRNKSNRFTYNYNITFTIIGRLNARITSENLGWFSEISSASQNATQYIQDATAIISGSVEILSNTTDNFTNLIFNPLRSLNDALVAFNGGTKRVLDIPRREIQQLKNNIENLKKNFSESIGIDTTSYNTIYGVNNTTKNVKTAASVNDYRIARSLSIAQKGLNIVLSNNDFFGKTDLLDIAQNVLNQYTGRLSIKNAQNYRLAKVLQNDSIQTIATRELGTAARFRELIILNQLKSPFIDTVKSNGVLVPGDDIMIPIEGANDDSSIILQNKAYQENSGLTFSELQLGTDLSLDKNFDLEINNLNDFKLKNGHNNAAQAVKIKIALEKNSLKYHPELGLNVKVGEKYSENLLSELQEDLKNTILSDPRFEDAQFNITVTNSTIVIEGVVKEKVFQLNTPINIAIKKDI